MPDEIHFELAREAKKSQKEKDNIIQKQNKNFFEKQSAEFICKELGIITPKDKDILKIRLWKEQNEFCPYSLRKITINDLLEPNMLEIDHILPYSRSFDDSQSNKVLVFRSKNQEKGNLTPYEKWGESEKWSDIENNAKSVYKRNKAKLNKILNKSFTDKDQGFRPNAINDTAYLSRFIKNYTEECLALPKPKNGKIQQIFSINGTLTTMLRRYWGLEKKNRQNHLHHAEDALIIAMSDQRMVKAFSDYMRDLEENKKREFQNSDFSKQVADHLKSDYKIRKKFSVNFAPDFRTKVIEAVNKIFVSKAVNKKLTGKLHEDKIYSKKEMIKILFESMAKINNFKDKDKNNKPILYTKQKIMEKIHEDIIEKVKDKFDENQEYSKQEISKIICMAKDDFKEFWEKDLVRYFKIFLKTRRIRKVRGGYACNAASGSMVRLDVYAINNKFFAVPIYTMDVAMGRLSSRASVSGSDKKGVLKEWKQMNEKDFKFSLFKNDLIKIQKDGMENPVLCYFEGFDIKGITIRVNKHDNKTSNLNTDEKILYLTKKDLETYGDYENKIKKENENNKNANIAAKEKYEKNIKEYEEDIAKYEKAMEKYKQNQDDKSKKPKKPKIPLKPNIKTTNISIETRIGIQNLKVFEKMQVSVTGEVRTCEFEPRQDIKLKSSPKKGK